MGSDTYYELTRRSIPIIKNEGLHIAWCNSVIIVHTGKRMNFLEFSYNLECLDKTLDFIESTIASPKDSPASGLFNGKFLKTEMRNMDYTEMLVNSAFWPHNPTLTQEMTAISYCEWSPPNFFDNKPVIAVLNNIGGVAFLSQQYCYWKCILNLSPFMSKALQYNNSPESFEELKQSVYIVETCAICWATNLNSDNSCYFVTAQRNGKIMFWQLYDNLNMVKVQAEIDTDLVNITRMLWIPKPDNKFWLILTTILGQINICEMQIGENKIDLLKCRTLWPHKDRMTAIGLIYTIVDNHLIFICGKHRHLLVQMLGEDGTVISQYLNNINDYRITDIASSKDGIYLSTVNFKIYKLNIVIANGELNVGLDLLNLKETYTNYDLYGIRFSANNVMCACAVVDRRVLCRKEAHKGEVLFLSTDSKLDSTLPLLINNPTKKLTYFWDCIELLRFCLIKLKIIPKIDYKELFAEGFNDSYKLKIYLILVIYFANLKKVLRVCSDVNLPETSIENLKEHILYQHAKSVIYNLFDKCQKNGMLSDFDMESLYGSKKYLEFYSMKNNIETELECDKNILNALSDSCEYICQCCDDKLEGFSCKSGHLNMFCMETFTPILYDDYLVCKCCSATTKSDLCVKLPFCVFCDLFMVKPD